MTSSDEYRRLLILATRLLEPEDREIIDSGLFVGTPSEIVGFPEMPDEITVLGGRSIFDEVGKHSESTIVLQSSLPAAGFRAVFQRAASDAGWITPDEPDTPEPFGGYAFLRIVPHPHILVLCNVARRSSMMADFREYPGDESYAKVAYFPDWNGTPCDPAAYVPRFGDDEVYEAVIPERLQRYFDSTIHTTSTHGSSGEGEEEFTFVIESKLELSGISSFYGEQLESSGWTLVKAMAGDPVHWSRWSLSLDSDEWVALATFTRLPKPESYLVCIYASKIRESGEFT